MRVIHTHPRLTITKTEGDDGDEDGHNTTVNTSAVIKRDSFDEKPTPTLLQIISEISDVSKVLVLMVVHIQSQISHHTYSNPHDEDPTTGSSAGMGRGGGLTKLRQLNNQLVSQLAESREETMVLRQHLHNYIIPMYNTNNTMIGGATATSTGSDTSRGLNRHDDMLDGDRILELSKIIQNSKNQNAQNHRDFKSTQYALKQHQPGSSSTTGTSTTSSTSSDKDRSTKTTTGTTTTPGSTTSTTTSTTATTTTTVHRNVLLPDSLPPPPTLDVPLLPTLARHHGGSISNAHHANAVSGSVGFGVGVKTFGNTDSNIHSTHNNTKVNLDTAISIDKSLRPSKRSIMTDSLNSNNNHNNNNNTYHNYSYSNNTKVPSTIDSLPPSLKRSVTAQNFYND